MEDLVTITIFVALGALVKSSRFALWSLAFIMSLCEVWYQSFGDSGYFETRFVLFFLLSNILLSMDGKNRDHGIMLSFSLVAVALIAVQHWGAMWYEVLYVNYEALINLLIAGHIMLSVDDYIKSLSGAVDDWFNGLNFRKGKKGV